MDRRNVQFVLAQHYGRKCRMVFPHGDWRQHEARIASGWSYMARELPWDQAREAVIEGWQTGCSEERGHWFSVSDNDDDLDDRRRALQ